VLRTLLSGLILVALVAPATARAQAQAAAPSPARAASTQDENRRETRDMNLRAYVELLRSDIRGQKVAIITQLMEFTEAEDAAFWPIYREYEVELTKLNDERVNAIKEYADGFENVTNELADKLALKALDLESRRNALKSKYYERVKTALSAKTAARFLQVENQLLMIIDLQIASSLPIVK
jgi:hypothetical protein